MPTPTTTRPRDGAPSTVARPSVLRWALAGTLVLALLVAVDVSRGGHPVGLVQPGADGPAAAVFRTDFPTVTLPDGLGLDGQMVYAIARDPWPVTASEGSLDRPRYRLQRPLLPWLGGALSPAGSGLPLVLVLAALGLAGILAGALALGRLSTGWGGPPWVAALFPLLPGAWWSLRVTVPDAAAVGLALLAVSLAARRRTGWAVAVGALAVLTKEPSALILVGWALAQRTRRDALVAAVPAAVGAGWMLALRLLVPGEEGLNGDIGPPFVGLLAAARDIWFDGRELIGMASTLGALALGALALSRRGLRHPLGAAILLHLGFLLVSGSNPLGMNFGGTRTGLALTALAIVALATPSAPPVAPPLPARRRGRRPAGTATLSPPAPS